jgi:hypothetical protein
MEFLPRQQATGEPRTRRYSQEEKDDAVRMVCTLRAALGTRQSPRGSAATATWLPKHTDTQHVTGPSDGSLLDCRDGRCDS